MSKKITPEFIRDRITQLRMQKNVTEYKMSYDLGCSRGYINNISTGKSLPSMKEFLNICDYFEISPADFFSPEQRYPIATQRVLKKLQQLPKDKLELILKLVDKLMEPIPD